MTRRKKRNPKKGISNLTNTILSILKKDRNQSFNYKQIAAKLHIVDNHGKQQIIQKIEEFKSQGKIEEIDRGKFKVLQNDHYYEGKVDVTSRGNGYVICDELEHDIYIPSRNLNHALHNDIVKVYVYNRKRSDKQEGDIVEILLRF